MNNEAEYLINKQSCRLKDIIDLIMDTGLGKDSLSIISQGNIFLLRTINQKNVVVFLKMQQEFLNIKKEN